MSSDSVATTDPRGRRLRRQAYLLTGDPLRAEQLTRRALEAAEVRSRQLGSDGLDEFSLSELVRFFVADASPGAVRRPSAAPPAPVSGAGYAPVWEALKVLPPRRRAVIVLRYDEGLNEEQIAGRLGTSPSSVAADADAGLLTLRTRLGRGEEPAELVPAALAAAAGDWSWGGPAAADGSWGDPAPAAADVVQESPVPRRYLGPADPGRSPAEPVPTTEPLAGSAAGPAPGGVRPAREEMPALRPRRGLALAAVAAGAVAVVVTAAVLVVPALRGGTDQPSTATAATSATAAATAMSSGAETAPSVPRGLLDWPARGRSAGDEAVLPTALAVWRSGAAAKEAPTGAATLLYAGRLDDRQVVVVQALDASGRARVAQLVGPDTTALKLVGGELLGPSTAFLSIVPPQGPTGPVRVLVAPEAGTDGLLASDVSVVPLRPAPVDADGVSGYLPSPPGTPNCSRVVVLGAADGDGGRPVLASGIVRADRLAPMTGDVEVGSPTLVAMTGTVPETRWFADGARLRKKIGGGPVVVAALGPLQSAAAPGVGTIRSQLYEVRRGQERWLGSVMTVGSKVVCTGADPVGSAGVRGEMTALVQRCPLEGGMMPGIVHVLGGAGVQSVRVDLAATARPAMQMPFSGTAERPSVVPSDLGFTEVVVVPHEFPCGTGRLTVVGKDLAVGGSIPVYLP